MRLPASHLDDLLAELAQADAVAGDSGLAPMTPKMLRSAGSASMPRSRSGAERWKKLSACDCTICARFMMRRRLGGGRRDAHGEDLVAGLGGGDQVADRADAADARHERRHLGEGPALAELLEAAELGDVEMRLLDAAVVVEVDGDLGVALDAGDGVDDDLSVPCGYLVLSESRVCVPSVWASCRPAGRSRTEKMRSRRRRAAGHEDVDRHGLVDRPDVSGSSAGRSSRGICGFERRRSRGRRGGGRRRRRTCCAWRARCR